MRFWGWIGVIGRQYTTTPVQETWLLEDREAETAFVNNFRLVWPETTATEATSNIRKKLSKFSLWLLEKLSLKIHFTSVTTKIWHFLRRFTFFVTIREQSVRISYFGQIFAVLVILSRFIMTIKATCIFRITALFGSKGSQIFMGGKTFAWKSNGPRFMILGVVVQNLQWTQLCVTFLSDNIRTKRLKLISETFAVHLGCFCWNYCYIYFKNMERF